MKFESTLHVLGATDLPIFTDTRVMMMPFRTDDMHTIPDSLKRGDSCTVGRWREVVERMCIGAPAGVGYLTIDEALVREGETHRRPGLHVDGIGPDGRAGGWGGGGGYAASGMVMVASHTGCRAYPQTFEGAPGPDGDCAHLAAQLDERHAVDLKPERIYRCSPLTVHTALPMPEDTWRQFCRVSFPSDAPWYEGYTENPLGIKPTGPIHPRRTKQMEYRP